MTSGCKDIYLIESGDVCYDIAISNCITLDHFYAYNPAVGNDCSGLWPNYYVRIGKSCYLKNELNPVIGDKCLIVLNNHIILAGAGQIPSILWFVGSLY